MLPFFVDLEYNEDTAMAATTTFPKPNRLPPSRPGMTMVTSRRTINVVAIRNAKERPDANPLL